VLTHIINISHSFWNWCKPSSFLQLAKHRSNKSWRLRWGMECWTSILTFTFGTAGTTQSSGPRADRIVPLKKIPWYSFLLQAEWAPGLIMNADKSHLKISNDPTGNRSRNSSPQPTAPTPHVTTLYLFTMPETLRPQSQCLLSFVSRQCNI